MQVLGELVSPLPPCPGGALAAREGAEGETAGLSWERQPSVGREGGREEELAAGAAENLLFFSHASLMQTNAFCF